jgi:hypothetical protein
VSGSFCRPSYAKPIVLSQNTILNLLFISALVAEGEEVAAVIEEVIAGTAAAAVGAVTAEVMAEARVVTEVAEAALDIEVAHRRDDRHRRFTEAEGGDPEGVVGIIVLDPDLILHVS